MFVYPGAEFHYICTNLEYIAWNITFTASITNKKCVDRKSCVQIWGSTLASSWVIYEYTEHTFDRLIDFIAIMAINTTWVADAIKLIWLPSEEKRP